MKTTELAELILLRLYDCAQSEGYDRTYELQIIAAEFGEADQMKVFNVAKFLEGKKLIRTSSAHNRGIRAAITGCGDMVVEQGGTIGVISAFRSNPGDFSVSVDQSTHFHAPISGSNVAVHSQGGSQSVPLSSELSGILDRIVHQLIQDSELAEVQRHELLADVRTLSDELQRVKPRDGIIRGILATLGDVASIPGLIIQVRPYLPF